MEDKLQISVLINAIKPRWSPGLLGREEWLLPMNLGGATGEKGRSRQVKSEWPNSWF